MHPPAGGAPLCPVLIGRAELLALAERRLAAAATGTGQLLLFAGEAGIGKTRLLTEVCARAGAHGATVLRIGAYPRDSEVAGGLLADLAATLRRQPGTTMPGTRMAARLREGADRVGDAYRQRRMLVTDLAEQVLALGAQDGPVLLAMEDLHWADELTLEVLDRAARRLASAPMLVIGTYRSDELFPRVPMRAWRTRLLTQRLAEEAKVPRLTEAETAAMAAAIVDGTPAAAVCRAVFERSDGIPLHIEEFLDVVSGYDRADPGADRPGVPDTLADAVLARAQSLSRSARAVADAASVIGRSFDLDLLTAVAHALPVAVDRALRELAQRFVVQPSRDGPTYDFRHALIRDALYADLAPHRRRDLHARVAEAANAAGFGNAFVSDQYERAHQPAPAYQHALAAAREAAALSAHQEAVELYRRAQRTTPAQTAPAERAELLTALAAELAAVDDNAAAVSAYTDAYGIWRDLGDDRAAAALVPALVAARHLLGADLAERVRRLTDALALIGPATDSSTQDTRTSIQAALAAAYMLDRRLEESIEFGEKARSRAADVGDRAIRLNTDATLGSALIFAGRMDEGWRLLEAAIAEARAAHLEAEAARGYRMLGSSASVLVEYERARHWLADGIDYAERTERFNDRHYMTAHLAHVLWATGDWPAATLAARQALADGRGGVTTRITALHVLGYLALGRAEWLAAGEYLQEARELGERMGELQRLSPALWGLAEMALHRGENGEAVRWCEQGLAASAQVDDAAYLFPFLVTGVRARLAGADLAAASEWFGRCARLLHHRAIPGTLPALDHASGLLQLAAGHPGLARDAFFRARAGWAERGRFWEGTQVLLDGARAARRGRRPAEAAALGAEAGTRAGAAGAVTLLLGADPRITGALDESGPASPSGLTAREVEVARLIATGATNRQIAATLHISPKTVGAHVEHILTKLGAARRTEIAAWASTRAPT